MRFSGKQIKELIRLGKMPAEIRAILGNVPRATMSYCRKQLGLPVFRGGKITHGMSYTREYIAWRSMKSRCLSKRHTEFVSYGSKGITVCNRWAGSFEAFFADMGKCPPGFTLGRIDNDGNYEPENCRWESQKDQQNNRRNNRLIEANGLKMTEAQWADYLGVSRCRIHNRIDRGWSPAMAVTVSVKPTPQRRNNRYANHLNK